ncbi:MAG: SgcJ/EcaC family oxidoreductase [Burkholderiaceae bacterium]|nr:SgcJ/EcaC family oxidoreductase [Burkholderiaceae bacterium]
MQADEQAIRQLVLNWGKATENGDTEQVLRMTAEDAVFLGAGVPQMNKKDFAAAFAGIKQMKLHVRSDIQEVKLLGDWAYCWNKLTVQIQQQNGAAAGKPTAPITRAGSALSIFRKENGAWLLVRDANMLSVVTP